MQGKAWGGRQRLEASVGRGQLHTQARQSLPDALERLDAALSRAMTSTAAKIIEFMVLEQRLEGRRINTRA